jgi:Sec-independent protein translocase protein TatA
MTPEELNRKMDFIVEASADFWASLQEFRTDMKEFRTGMQEFRSGMQEFKASLEETRRMQAEDHKEFASMFKMMSDLFRIQSERLDQNDAEHRKFDQRIDESLRELRRAIDRFPGNPNSSPN